MYKETIERYYHMKCDICGKTEIIKDEDFKRVPGWWTRHWSALLLSEFGDWKGECSKELNLCPTCTKKFKKILKNVEIDESEE